MLKKRETFHSATPLMGDKCGATPLYIDVKNSCSVVEHEATTSKIGEDQLLYCNQRGIPEQEAIALIVNGYCKEVLQKLPMGCCRSKKIIRNNA